MVQYELKGHNVLKDGHTMFVNDIVYDLQRKSVLEDGRGRLGELYNDFAMYEPKEIKSKIEEILKDNCFKKR